ncbi:MAG: P-loop NTPase [Thermodesulfobacteriota bacterium]
MTPQEVSRARVAAIYLFGTHQALKEGFWASLNMEMLKDAFRRKARRYHPDLQGRASSEAIKKNREWFIKVKESYDILKEFIYTGPEEVTTQEPTSKKFIAVGGAKGGIGKSMFTTNLGVFLATQGHRTVMVDLDLGGANLHLYLGETYLKFTVNDFINKIAPSLTDVMIATKYGPWLIGGNSSQLGSSNISFAAKMKLIKSLRNLEADCILVDLGSDTSYNILDFFLAADIKIVLTTCDPASYLEAYNLIKVGLYRRLNRIFGEESLLPSQKNHDLQKLIYEATMPANGDKVKNIQELIKRVQKSHPDYVPYVKEALESYQPYLVVNKVSPQDQVKPIVRRIQEVARKMLGIQVKYLGALPLQEEVQQSTRDLVPVVARHTQGRLAQQLAHIVKEI